MLLELLRQRYLFVSANMNNHHPLACVSLLLWPGPGAVFALAPLLHVLV